MSSVASLIAKVRTTLIDEDASTWPDDELLGYVEMAVNKACAALLDLFVDVIDHNLEPGMRQYLPEGALILIDSSRNGDGAPVTQQGVAELSRIQREWGNATAGQPQFFMYDKRAPRTFQVFPPADSGSSMELVVGAIPPPLGLSDEMPISAWFDSAVWAFACGMALAKNTSRQDLTKTGVFMGMFGADIATWKASKDATAAPPDRQGVH